MTPTRLWSCLLCLCLTACAPAEPLPWFLLLDEVRIQEGDDPRWASPDWNDRSWRLGHWGSVGSYQRVVWLRARIDGAKLPEAGAKVAVSAVAAHEVYWNGVSIGGNGRPAGSRAEEVAGRMDSVSPVPSSLVTSGENLLAVRLSSFHLGGKLNNTLHLLYLSAEPDLMALRLRMYLPGLMAGGALLLGACYFLALFLSDRRDRAAGYLGMLTLAALAQFAAEASRAFVNYPYPLHLTRLWVILAMAVLYGLMLVAYVTQRCAPRLQRQALLGTALVIAIAIALIPGYDTKTAATIAVAALVSFGIGACTRPRRALILFAPTSLLLGFAVAPAWHFIDEHFYLITAAAIVLLFFEQVRHLRLERTARAAVELRSARLELELLKRYIQPHFLLNTLTSLAEWVETDPAVGVRMIEALAEEFRLLSRIGAQRTIALRDEIALCRLHLQVMSLRHDARLELRTAGIDESQLLPPAILHTLIENALTHGRYPGGATFELHESVDAKYRRYELCCPPTEGAASTSQSAGTGLDYVRARLSEVFADRWRVTAGRTEQGGWTTRIEVPVVACT